MNLDDLARQDPNFTVLVPGGCNAKCAFCFWNASSGRIRPPADYAVRLEQVLTALPANFTAISVSGGGSNGLGSCGGGTTSRGGCGGGGRC